jgi:O-antigen/teichoic acid export membrane protein
MPFLVGIDAKKRNENVKFQIYLSFILRGLSVFLSFLVIRITIEYLGNDLYGIWIVLLSTISWLSLFDIGVGHGLRNKLTIALANNDLDAARSYISTAYVILSAVAFLLLLIFCCCIWFVDWVSIFNSTLLSLSEYRLMMFLFIFSIIFSFVLGLINSILNAFQKTELTNVVLILTNIFFLSFLFFYKTYFISNIVKIVFIYSLSSVISNLLFTFYFFAKNNDFIPHHRFFSRSKIKDVLTLGVSFFVIQIAGLFIYATDNYVILQLLGSKQVSVYNIAFKLFSIYTVLLSIVIAPLWSAFTEANEKNDYVWMKATINKLNILFLAIVLCLVGMLEVYQPILDFWLPTSNRIIPSYDLLIALSVFVAISIWNNIYAFCLNGLGIVKMQVRTSILGALVNIPLAIFFVNYLDLGLSGVVYAMCLSLILFSILGPIATFKYLRKISND